MIDIEFIRLGALVVFGAATLALQFNWTWAVWGMSLTVWVVLGFTTLYG